MMSAHRAIPGLVGRIVAGAFLAVILVPALAAQVPGPAYATRAALEQQLQGRSGEETRLIRVRLESGDFRPGDRILLTVEGEKELSDTFTVGMATELPLPQIGVIPLAGVLRAELHGRLSQSLARYFRTPVVHVRSLMRVSVEGEVGQPGFYALAPETPLMDALTRAGGLTRDARLDKVRVEREGTVVLSGRELESAVRSGRTFDGLNLRAGDRVYIPRKGNFAATAQTLAMLMSIPITIYTAIRIF